MCRARFLCHPEGKRARSCSASEASGLVASRSSLQVGALPKVRLVQAVSSLSSGGAPSAKVPQASLASGARSSCAIQARKRARSFFASEVSGQVAARPSSQVGACRRPRCRRLLQASLLIGRLRRNALLALAMPGAREAATLLTSSSDAGARSRSVAGCRLCPFRRKLKTSKQATRALRDHVARVHPTTPAAPDFEPWPSEIQPLVAGSTAKNANSVTRVFPLGSCCQQGHYAAMQGTTQEASSPQCHVASLGRAISNSGHLGSIPGLRLPASNCSL